MTKAKRPAAKSNVPKNVKTYVDKKLQANTEVNHYESGYVGYNPDTSGIIVNLSDAIAPYTGASLPNQNRTTDGATLKSLHLWGAVVLNTSGDAYNQVRMTIVRWHPNSVGSSPAMGHIYEDTGDAWESSYNYDNRQSFTVLEDKKFLVQQGIRNVQPFDIRLFGNRLSSHPMKYASISANGGSDHIYMILSSDSGAVIHPSVQTRIHAAWSPK